MEKETLEKIVALYMEALGDEKLSEETWKRIARVNSVILGGIDK